MNKFNNLDPYQQRKLVFILADFKTKAPTSRGQNDTIYFYWNF